MATVRLNTDTATLALNDLRNALVRLRGALHPDAPTLRARLDTLVRELQVDAPKTATLAALELDAADILARQLWTDAEARHADAVRALADAEHQVQRNSAALDAVPDFIPPHRGTETGAEHQTRALRAELTLRDVRAELRELDLGGLLDAHAAAHREHDWLVATASEAELRRLARLGATSHALGRDTDAVLRNKARIQHALDTARTQRRALVDAESAATVARHEALLRESAAELRTHDLLVAELRTRGRVPVRLA